MVPKPLQKLGGDSPLMSTGPTSPILAQYRQVVLWPLYVNSTTLCICLLLFPFRFCHSCHVSFCYMSLVFMLILHSMKGMGSWACTVFFYFLMGLDIVLVEVPICLARWAFAPIASFLAVSMGVLAIILAMLAHWAHYLSFLGLPWPIYFIFYLLLCPWAYLLSFMPCWPIRLITSFLGLPQPIYLTFISCYAYRHVGCHSQHVGPLG